MYFGVELNLAYALMTLFTASRKSFSVATFRLERIANIPKINYNKNVATWNIYRRAPFIKILISGKSKMQSIFLLALAIKRSVLKSSPKIILLINRALLYEDYNKLILFKTR